MKNVSKKLSSVVNKDLTFKAKAKDLAFKAKAKAKDLTSRTSLKTAFDRGVFTVFVC